MTTVELKVPGQFHTSPLPQSTVNRAKKAFTTRHVPPAAMKTLLTGELVPRPGDLVLARVDRIRQHARIELANGRRSRLFVGDLIVVAYGNRYAPDQFEALVPQDLAPCHLVAGGGVASKMRVRSPKVKPATEITPLGLLADAKGKRLNLQDWCKPGVNPKQASQRDSHLGDVPVFLVIGSSMNAGKTTTAARLIHGLAADGYRVGAMKITGTGSGGDLWHFKDAGAMDCVDFTDAGHASTYKASTQACLNVFYSLGDYLLEKGAQVLVVEVADGILQEETEALLKKPDFVRQISATWYCAADSAAALYGLQWLSRHGYSVEALSGVFSSNPLATAEVEKHCQVPVVSKNDLTAPGYGHGLMERFEKDSASRKQTVMA